MSEKIFIDFCGFAQDFFSDFDDVGSDVFMLLAMPRRFF